MHSDASQIRKCLEDGSPIDKVRYNDVYLYSKSNIIARMGLERKLQLTRKLLLPLRSLRSVRCHLGDMHLISTCQIFISLRPKQDVFTSLRFVSAPTRMREVLCHAFLWNDIARKVSYA